MHARERQRDGAREGVERASERVDGIVAWAGWRTKSVQKNVEMRKTYTKNTALILRSGTATGMLTPSRLTKKNVDAYTRAL